jgi:hypothetical protein
MHYLHSDDTEELIESFETFDKLGIKKAIVAHLKENPEDQIEFSKDFSPEDQKKYVGRNILDFYANKSGHPCKLIFKGTRGEKTFYKKLIL